MALHGRLSMAVHAGCSQSWIFADSKFSLYCGPAPPAAVCLLLEPGMLRQVNVADLGYEPESDIPEDKADRVRPARTCTLCGLLPQLLEQVAQRRWSGCSAGEPVWS